MEKEFCVHYHDERLSLPYQAITIKTNNIDQWLKDFVSNNSPHVTVMEWETSA